MDAKIRSFGRCDWSESFRVPYAIFPAITYRRYSGQISVRTSDRVHFRVGERRLFSKIDEPDVTQPAAIPMFQFAFTHKLQYRRRGGGRGDASARGSILDAVANQSI